MHLTTPTIPHLLTAAQQCWRPGHHLHLWLAEEGAPDLGMVATALRAMGVASSGALVPAVISGGVLHRRGAVLLDLGPGVRVKVAAGLSSPPETAEPARRPARRRRAPLVVAWADRQSAGAEGFFAALSQRYGPETVFLGGGAGGIQASGRPVVFTEEGAWSDAGIVLEIDAEACWSVGHGWERLHGPPVVATRAEGRALVELDGRPAFGVYRSLVEARTGVRLEPSAFEAARAFPLGIDRAGGGDLVRLPLAVRERDGALVCTGAVAPRTSLRVLRGVGPRLLAAARDAASGALANHGGARPAAVLLLACVARERFLAERFQQELAAVDEIVTGRFADRAVFGALAHGVLAGSGAAAEEPQQKSLAVAALHARG